MNLLHSIRTFLGSDIWFLLGFLNDVPLLVWFFFTNNNEFNELKEAIVGDLDEYFHSF